MKKFIVECDKNDQKISAMEGKMKNFSSDKIHQTSRLFGENGKGCAKTCPSLRCGLENLQSTPLFFERERGRGGKGKPSFPVKRKFSLSTAHSFTLIELPVVIAQHCRHFFRGFICTDQYGCVRKHTESAALKNTPH
ncbi:MAG: hypothetical protein IKC94_02115, partial [Lentisphaeria bacterium]|nr:hypothetical protein [Lentisphaeria bacterium]